MSMDLRFGTSTCEAHLYKVPSHIGYEIERCEEPLQRYLSYVEDNHPVDLEQHEAEIRVYMVDHPTAEWSVQ